MIHIKFGSVPVLVVCSAKSAKQVLKIQDLAFCSRPKFFAQQKISYNCMDMVFSPYNDYWREVRKITNIHLFSLKKVQSFGPVREEEVYRMIKKITRLESCSGDPAVNLSEIVMNFASSIICRVAFGKRYEEEGSEMRRFGELTKTAQALLTTFFVSDYFPLFSWVDKLSGLMNRLYTTFKDLDSFYQEVIDEHLDRNMMKGTDVEDDDILDVLIRLKEDKSCSVDFQWDHIKALLTAQDIDLDCLPGVTMHKKKALYLVPKTYAI
ncbi:hypothetical protein BUALT_Bualt02G0147100 [Buddleja alternifolia]|uniref:Cytochrome P450 n=1 Tax=Buddleja alternifolia TaxID=168488 RepID=A0AAV6Y6H1_9LAMI|nr:hypothetical protein BUALT_Bualt02G0147100 [Buddleja alternifolia]